MKVNLTVEAGPHRGRRFSFGEHDNFIVGRSSCAHFRLPQKDRFFSRVHFMVEVNPPFCRLMDMGSRNGTFVNSRKVATTVDLQDGDMIQGGQTIIRVAIVNDNTAAPPADAPVEPPPTTAMEGPLGAPPPPPRPPAVRPPTAPPRGNGSPRPDGTAIAAAAAADSEPVASPVKPKPVAPLPDPASTDLSQLPTSVLELLPSDYEERIRKLDQFIPGHLLVREIGRGGMGTVYLAIRPDEQAVVALKVIEPAHVSNSVEVGRFLRETDILRQLDHPNIVAFRDMGETSGLLYFSMEYVHGCNALEYIQQDPELPPVRRAVGIICQLMLGVTYAHSKGFVHRDIKPANVLLTQVGGRGLVKLTDFGLARAYQTSRLSGLTVMGETAGTLAFMAPEQITSFKDAKPAVDQFACAATLYFLLTKCCIHDFPSSQAQQLLLLMQEDAVPIQSRRSDIPDGLAAAIHRALQRKPEERFPDLDTFRNALLPFCS